MSIKKTAKSKPTRAARVRPVEPETVASEPVNEIPTEEEAQSAPESDAAFKFNDTFDTAFTSAVNNFNEGVKAGINLAEQSRKRLTKDDLGKIDNTIHSLRQYLRLSNLIGSGAAVSVSIDETPVVFGAIRTKLFDAVTDTITLEIEDLSNQLFALGVDPNDYLSA